MDEGVLVGVLLKEYDTLRAEILQRMSHRFTLLGFAGALGGYAFFSAEGLSVYQLAVLAAGSVALFVTWWQLGRVMVKCSDRIADIEREVNRIADNDVLLWESERLGSKSIHALYEGRRTKDADRRIG